MVIVWFFLREKKMLFLSTNVYSELVRRLKYAIGMQVVFFARYNFTLSPLHIVAESKLYARAPFMADESRDYTRSRIKSNFPLELADLQFVTAIETVVYANNNNKV